MQASSPTGAGQGPAGPCRIFLPPTGNAPLRLRLAAHPPPLAGEALGRLPFERLPCKGSCRRQPTEGCGALPCQYLSGLPGNLTAADGSAAGEIARPTLRPWAGGSTKSAAARQARRWADAGITPLPRGRRPAVPGSTSRLPCIAGRAFTPAGEVGGGGRALAGRLSAAGLQSLAAVHKTMRRRPFDVGEL